MNWEKYSKPLLRISLSLIFLYFGFMQIYNTEEWIGFVPDFALSFGLSASTLVLMNGFLELVAGTFLIAGLCTKIAALILSLHLYGIAFSIGLNPLGIRDFGLATATFAVFLNGADFLCLDKRLEKTYK